MNDAEYKNCELKVLGPQASISDPYALRARLPTDLRTTEPFCISVLLAFILFGLLPGAPQHTACDEKIGSTT